MLYGTNGNLWYHGLPEGIQPVSSEWGYQQGGAEANDGYCTATRPFHMALQDILKNEPGLLAEYVDDLNAAADFERMIFLIGKVLELGPKYGYILRMDKGSYMMAKCDTDAEANERYERLLAIGLDPKIIHRHPDNVADPGAKAIAAKQYGAETMGSPIGSMEYIQEFLGEKASCLEDIVQQLIDYPDHQQRMLLVRFCFNPKIYHLFRTIPTHQISEEFIRRFEECQRALVKSVINTPNRPTFADTHCSDAFWTQCKLSIINGGYGMGFLKDIAHAAYVSSIIACQKILNTIYPDFKTDFSTVNNDPDILFSHMRGAFQDGVAKLHQSQSSINIENIFQFRIPSGKDRPREETLQHFFTSIQEKQRLNEFTDSLADRSHLAFHASECNKNAGRWITAQPKTNEFTFTNAEYTATFCYWFHLPQPSVHPGSHCNCKFRPMIDLRGHHLFTKCGKEGFRHENHDIILDLIMRILRLNGIRNAKEISHVFWGTHPETKSRMDIVIPVQAFTETTILIDVNLTAPDSVPTTNNETAKTAGRAAKKSYNYKVSKYGQRATANGHRLLPFIFETTGYLHPKSEKLLDDVISFGAEASHRDKETSKRYVMSLLNVILMKRMANTVLHRTMKLNGNPPYASRGSAFHPDNIREYEYMNSGGNVLDG
jgi:hypothetical protein